MQFEPGSDLKVRELELQRIAAALQREQPRGTVVNVATFDTSLLSSIAMMVHVLGSESDDRNALFDLAEELVVPRFASVSGIQSGDHGGGGGRQVTVTVDPDRAAALGVSTEAVSQAVADNVGHLRFLGQLESESGRVPVILDGRAGLTSLGEARIQPDLPVRLRHLSELRYGPGREEMLFRVNGQPAVGVILFQEEGANLVRLGRRLRERVAMIQEELRPQGVDLGDRPRRRRAGRRPAQPTGPARRRRVRRGAGGALPLPASVARCGGRRGGGGGEPPGGVVDAVSGRSDTEPDHPVRSGARDRTAGRQQRRRV